ncbi:EAL domain-containing protein [uncultured Gimesia sp.]|uniref:putative bifunctional diguanylate cyclase/phosphodiesterase n=1 Tax=uncultured Gimesia sp. TaxID=1678688 RepID=UPI0030D9A4A3|tara:strand:+ start:22136 stop:24394 length:2259 start_codon:yes stop_codon:yes gene_type:complete
MYKINESRNRRILVIDDNEAIHDDFRKVLVGSAKKSKTGDSFAAFFGEEAPTTDEHTFEVDAASQGREGLEKVRQSIQDDRPYAMAFVDIRMPPGWDGIETVGHLWEVDPDLLIVICTAYNDYNWTEMSQQLGCMDRWLILKKPFDNVEVRQLASSLTEKWDLARKAELKLDELQQTVGTQNRELAAFRKAVDAAGIVAMIDLEGTILEANDNFCEVSGYTHDELVGQNHNLVLSDHHPVEFFEELYATVEQNKIWRGEICNQAKNGSLYWVDTTIVPMLDENNATVSYFTLRIEISDRKRLMGQLHTQAYNDSLTGLPNRASILDSIQNAIDRGPSHHFALLFLDFDRFKLINDSLGHDMGDQLLKEIAQRLTTTLRGTDQIKPARLGGDEFVVLLNRLTNLADATIVAERLLDVFSQSYQLGTHTVYSTASIGVVTSEYQYESANDMLRDADLAMYKAKAAGHGSYLLFDQTMREKAQYRLRLEGDLREAIEQGEFTLFYQPIVALESGQLEGLEALVRWKHPERGLISPDDFIPVAEETGLISAIGKWCLDEACRQFAEWRQTFGDDAPAFLHVNVSRRQLLDPNLINVVKRVIEKHAIPPEHLHLEVTESLIMEDQKTFIPILKELRKTGVKVDMDDFGTGHSSLSCLHEFPLDVLKIDRSFVMNAKHVRDYAALLQAILTLADNLELQVVAEGISDPEQLILLQALGCEYGQGYLFAEPSSAEEIQALFGAHTDWTKNSSEIQTATT